MPLLNDIFVQVFILLGLVHQLEDWPISDSVSTPQVPMLWSGAHVRILTDRQRWVSIVLSVNDNVFLDHWPDFRKKKQALYSNKNESQPVQESIEKWIVRQDCVWAVRRRLDSIFVSSVNHAQGSDAYYGNQDESENMEKSGYQRYRSMGQNITFPLPLSQVFCWLHEIHESFCHVTFGDRFTRPPVFASHWKFSCRPTFRVGSVFPVGSTA